MNFGDYIKDKWIACTLIVWTGILIGIFQALLLLDMAIIIITLLPFYGVTFLLLYGDYRMRKNFYDHLLETFEELDEKSYLAEVVKKPGFYEGKVAHSLLKAMGRDMNEKVQERDKEVREYKEYMESWVHEIKLPIATAKLTVANNKNEVTLSLEEEIDRIDNYVEQVLYYARSEAVEKDHHMEWFKLEDLVRSSVKKYARDFIGARITPEFQGLDLFVLSDKKWTGFILGQLIQNAIKYRGEAPKISFWAKKEAQGAVLCVEDNGVGILPEDLPRVFSKGFTGSNVRSSGGSTGIGLYLCERLCNSLGLSVTIDSEINKGTRVMIHFPKAQMSKPEI